MRSFYISIFFTFLTLVAPKAFAQEDNKFNSDTIPSLDFETVEDPKDLPKKKKKVKKKVFYGLKCKKGFTKKGTGAREEIEVFYYLKHYKEPNPYVKNIYVYDIRKQKIVLLTEIKKAEVQFYKILHGPYKRTQAGSVVEQGIFFVGTKHGRWEKYAAKKKETYGGEDGKEEVVFSILIDKEKYYKGWPKESKITFYDGAQTKIKEVIPYEFGKLNGDYYFFKENGEILKQGKYIEGKKVGIWVEYAKDKNRKIKETQYPATPYVEQFEPYILTQWDDNGNITVSKGKVVEPGKKAADPLKDRYKRKKK